MQRNSPHISCFLSGKCQNACNDSIQAAQYGCLHVLWQSDMDTMTHISAGAQQVFLATWSSVCVCVCSTNSHLSVLTPALGVCNIGIRKIIFFYLSPCAYPPPLTPAHHLIPPFHPCLSFCLTPSIHLFPSIPLLCSALFLLISLHLSSLPFFIPLSIQNPLAWHSISDTSCMSCSNDASALTDQPQCVILLEEGEEEDWGGGHIDRKWPAEPQTALLS